MNTEPPPELPGMGPETGRGRLGRVAAAVRVSVDGAQLDTRDKGAGELAVELARAVDVASAVRNDPYGVATAARELREQLTRLRLDPASRGDAASDLTAWLDSLDDETPDASPVSHPPNA